MTVLLTGAAGRIGRSLHARLPGLGWDVRGFDRVAVPDGDRRRRQLRPTTSTRRCTASPPSCTSPASRPRRPWPVVRDANVDGMLERLRGRPPGRGAAGRAGLVQPRRRLHPRSTTSCRPTSRPVPTRCTASARSSARRSAATTSTATACRSRACGSAPSPSGPTDPRSLSTWLSPGDCARLVDACLRSPDLDYAVVWGVSANTRGTWTCRRPARSGYEPQDDAEDYAGRAARRGARPVGRARRRRLHVARLRHRRGAGALAGARMSSDRRLHDEVRAWIADDVDPAAAAELQALLDAARRRRAPRRAGRPVRRAADLRHGRPARAAARRAQRHEPRRRAPRRRRARRVAARARARRRAGRRRLRRAARLGATSPRDSRGGLRRRRLRRPAAAAACCRRRCSPSRCGGSGPPPA